MALGETNMTYRPPLRMTMSADSGSTTETPAPGPMTVLLHEAAELVEGDRNADYGDPRDDFAGTAAMWSAYLGVPIKLHDVAAMMVMVKLSRIRKSPEKRDHWLDAAGYAATGWRCVTP